METTVPSKLLTTLSHAAEITHEHDFIQIYSHYDADGVSAAAIVAKALLRLNKEFRITLFTTLNDYNMDIIRSTKADCIIVTDLGASYVEQMDAMTKDIIVLDHHSIIAEAKRICYANPHLYGIDGMTSGCGATMAFLYAITLDENNWDLVQVAFAGIAGDRQHIGELTGLNAYLLEGAKERGLISEEPGSLIPAGNLESQLFLCTDPYIRGVSGNKEGVKKILDDAGIAPGKSYSDLNDEEKRRLSSLIAVKLVQQGMLQTSLEEISRKRYHLNSMDIDAEYLSAILNSCGRAGFGGIGISAGLGDKKSMELGYELTVESNKEVIDNVLKLDEMGLNQRKHFQWFDSSDFGFTGMLCGISMQCFGNSSKPTLGMNKSKEPVNLSSRGMWCQLEKGIDLAVAMREACDAVGGEGGGHKIAAGGSVPGERVEEFLDKLDSILEEQLSSSK